MKVFIFNAIIAVISSFIFLPVWLSGTINATPIQIIFNLIILPVILCGLNVILFLKGKLKSFNTLYFIMPIACILGELIGYLNWGISTGNLLKPDGETIMLTKYFVLASAIVPILLCGLSHLILFLAKKL